MTVPKPFEMVYGGEIYIVSYQRDAASDRWLIFVEGAPFAKGLRNNQNSWEVVADKTQGKYLGRILQQAVMDCVRGEFRKDDLG